MNPMFTLTGQVVNVYVAPKGISKKTGEEFGGDDKVQIMGQIPVDGGQFRLDVITLSTDKGDLFRGVLNEEITLPVAFWARQSTVGYYIPRGVPLNLRKQA
jgi:hypothetical protein